MAKAIVVGVENRVFGYISGGAPTLGEDGKYQVPPDKVRFDRAVAVDEIDLESGFIMLPRSIPQGAPVAVPGGTQPGQPPQLARPSAARSQEQRPCQRHSLEERRQCRRRLN